MNGRVGKLGAQGFTVVELLIVVVVIAILATITIVAFNGIQDRAKVSAVKSSVSQGVKKVLAYAALHSDTYPSNATDAGLISDASTTYEVSSATNGASKSYCVTATTEGKSYFQTSSMNEPFGGTCIGMLAWWPMNGSAEDASGHGVGGTVVGATLTTGVGGKENSAYQLGESAQYITIGSPSSFSVVPNAFTYSLWLARTGDSTYQWPGVMGASNLHADFGVRAMNYGRDIAFEYGKPPYDGSVFSDTSTKSLLTLNEWHNLVVTYNGSVIVSYWDGELYHTSSSVVLHPTMPSFALSSASNGWRGKVDDVRVYNRPLSASEARTLYMAGAY